jgi:hypothetical protein
MMSQPVTRDDCDAAPMLSRHVTHLSRGVTDVTLATISDKERYKDRLSCRGTYLTRAKVHRESLRSGNLIEPKPLANPAPRLMSDSLALPEQIHGLTRLVWPWCRGHLPMIKHAAASVIGPALGPVRTGNAINARFIGLSCHMAPVCLSAATAPEGLSRGIVPLLPLCQSYVGRRRERARTDGGGASLSESSPRTRRGQKPIAAAPAPTSRAHHFRLLSGSKKEKFPENIPEKPVSAPISAEINCDRWLRR